MPAVLTQLVYLNYEAGAYTATVTPGFNPRYRVQVDAQTTHRARQVDAQTTHRARVDSRTTQRIKSNA